MDFSTALFNILNSVPQDTFSPSSIQGARGSSTFSDIFSVRGMFRITKTDDSYVARVEVPGFTREQISITSRGQKLFVSASSDDESLSDISCSTLIPETGRLADATSVLSNGILTVKVPINEIVENVINIQ